MKKVGDLLTALGAVAFIAVVLELIIGWKMIPQSLIMWFSITVVKSEISNDKQKQSVDALISILYIEFGKGNQKLLYIRNRL